MRMLPIILGIVAIGLTSACSKDEESTSSTTNAIPENTGQIVKSNLENGSPSILVAANSKTKICENMIQGERIQYRVDFSSKLHFGVSAGQEIDDNAPTPMHITLSEVRAFSVKVSGDHCFHFDNREPHDTSVTLSHTRL